MFEWQKQTKMILLLFLALSSKSEQQNHLTFPIQGITNLSL